MRKALVAATISAAMLLGGCESLFGPRGGSELVGRSVRLVPARGQTSTLYFGHDGVVRSYFGRNSAAGRWWVRRGQLCFRWAGDFQECWPYAAPFQRGRTVWVRSDRGNLVRVTLL